MQAPGHGAGLLHFRQSAFRMMQIQSSSLRQKKASRGALHKVNAEAVFQSGNSPAHGRLRHSQAFRRLRKAARPRDKNEELKPV